MSLTPQSPSRAREDTSDATMGFLDHLDELRTRVIRSLLAVGIGMAAAFLFLDQISAFVLDPVKRALQPGSELVAIGLTESFSFNVDLALIGGVVLSAPFVTYQVWRFVAPGLYASERRLVVPLALMATAGTLAGAAFGHYVLFPSSVAFLSRWLPKGVRLMAGLSDTFGLYKSMMLGMVAVFQLPAVIFLLARLRAVTAGFLWRSFGHAVIVIVVAAALITPTTDAWNLLFTATPMLVMYVLSIGIAWLARPRDAARASSGHGSSALGLLVGAAMFEVARRRRERSHRLRPLPH